MSAEDATTIRRLRDAVRSLEDENEALRSALRTEKLDEDARVLMQRLGIKRYPARFLMRLYRAHGATVTHDVLNAATGYRQTRPEHVMYNPAQRVNTTLASNLRKVFPYIVTVHGIGYALAPKGVALIKEIFNDAKSV